MSKQRHVEQNIRSVDFKLDPELLREIWAVVEPVKDRTWPSGRPENWD